MYTFNIEWYTHIHVQVFKGLIPSVLIYHPMHRQESTTLVDTPGSQLIGHNKMNLSCSSKTNIAWDLLKYLQELGSHGGTQHQEITWIKNDPLTAITSKLVTCYCINYWVWHQQLRTWIILQSLLPTVLSAHIYAEQCCYI